MEIEWNLVIVFGPNVNDLFGFLVFHLPHFDDLDGPYSVGPSDFNQNPQI